MAVRIRLDERITAGKIRLQVREPLVSIVDPILDRSEKMRNIVSGILGNNYSGLIELTQRENITVEKAKELVAFAYEKATGEKHYFTAFKIASRFELAPEIVMEAMVNDMAMTMDDTAWRGSTKRITTTHLEIFGLRPSETEFKLAATIARDRKIDEAKKECAETYQIGNARCAGAAALLERAYGLEPRVDLELYREAAQEGITRYENTDSHTHSIAEALGTMFDLPVKPARRGLA
ncbi:MAG: hypothetical protein ABII22_00370 [Candidatus Micrarchaeota archaeon]